MAFGTLPVIVQSVGNRAALLPRQMLLGFGVLAGYLLLDALSFIHPLQSLNITPWSPQRALLIALVLYHGAGWIGWIYVTVLVSEIVVGGMYLQLGSALALAAVLACAYVAIACLIREPLRVRLDLPTRQDVVRLSVAVVLGAGITGALYVGALYGMGGIDRTSVANAMFRFWIGDCIGTLVTLPLLLLLLSAPRRRELGALAIKPELLLEIAVLVITMLFVLTRPEADQSRYFYLLFLPLIWIAARHGLAGATLALFVVQVGIIAATMLSGHQAPTMVELQTLLLAYVLTGLLLGATVDELRSTADKLARARQLTIASEMATALAHELNQPLTALSTYADAIRVLAKSGEADSAMLAETAERIRRVATRSADIVERFRNLGAPTVDRPNPLDLQECIAAAVGEVRERAEQRGIIVHVDVSKNVPRVRLDRERIRFVVLNLLSNAIDAIGDRSNRAGRIELRVRRNGHAEIEMVVEDSGPGIPKDMVERIFEPFYTGKAKGMGLGLAVSRSIVESHAGRMWAEASDHGIFHIRLPL